MSYTKVNIPNEYIDLTNLDTPIKTNNKVPVKFKHESGSKAIEELRVLKPKTYSFENYTAKEKGIKNANNGKHKD